MADLTNTSKVNGPTQSAMTALGLDLQGASTVPVGDAGSNSPRQPLSSISPFFLCLSHPKQNLSPPPATSGILSPFRQLRGPYAGPGGMTGGEGRLSGWGYECGSRT